MLAKAAARAHADAEPDDQQAAQRYGKARRTATHWRSTGPPQVRGFQTYLYLSSDPYRMVAEVKATAKHKAVEKETTPELIEGIRLLLRREKEAEGVDNGNDCRRGMNWLDRAAQKERDAAIDEELAARFRECACRGLKESEVLGLEDG